MRLFIIGTAVVTAIALAVGGAAMAQGGGTSDDRDEVLSGARADRAGAAAVEALGAGTVSAVERDSDSAFEVEVAKPDGSAVEVELNGSFEVVEVESDDDAGDNDSRDDDSDRDDGPNDRDDDSDDGPNDD